MNFPFPILKEFASAGVQNAQKLFSGIHWIRVVSIGPVIQLPFWTLRGAASARGPNKGVETFSRLHPIVNYHGVVKKKHRTPLLDF